MELRNAIYLSTVQPVYHNLLEREYDKESSNRLIFYFYLQKPKQTPRSLRLVRYLPYYTMHAFHTYLTRI